MGNKIYIKKIQKEIDIDNLYNKLSPNENDILFISGSLIEGQNNICSDGMGNKRSDIDVFILTDRVAQFNNNDYDENYCKTTFLELDGEQFDVEIYRISDLIYFWECLNEINFNDSETDNVRTMNLLKIERTAIKKYMSLTHRLLNGICIHNNQQYEEIKKKINMENYYVYNIRTYVNIIDLCYDDVLGYLEEGQGILAVLMARNLLLNAAAVHLLKNRISFDRDKWIPLLMENLSKKNAETTVLFEEFKELLFCDNLKNNKDFLKNARYILLWVNKIIEHL